MSKFLARLGGLNMQKVLLIGAIALGLYYVSLYDDGSKIELEIQTTDTQIAEQDKKQKESEEALKAVEQVRAQIATLSDQYRTVSAQLPSEVQPAENLTTIENLATAAGVSIRRREPRKTERKDILEELPIQVSADGQFGQVALFLYQMMSSERVSKILSFTIFKEGGFTGNRADFDKRKVVMDAVFINYRFIGNETAAAAVKAGP